EGETGSFLKQAAGESVGQPQGIQHELEREFACLDLAVLDRRLLHIGRWLLAPLVARNAVGEADFSVRAGADAEIVAELPVVEVVPAAMAGPGESRRFIVFKKIFLQKLF